jgi:pimeloyl-ACP methyl ester carboxylesterase
VLVVQGALDRLVPAAAGEYLARTLGAAALATISGAAHAPFISQPRSVSRTIFEFLDAH